MKQFPSIQRALAGEGTAWGVHCSSQDIELYEVCGLVGYDFVLIDHACAANSLPNIKNGLIASNAAGCAAFVRVPSSREEFIKPVLELGPQGVVIPRIKTAEDAAEAARQCTYPPRGSRGYGPSRAMDYGGMPLSEYLENVDRNMLTIAQCDSRQGVEELAQILAVPGIDGVLLAPAELAADIGAGSGGQLSELIERFAETCRGAGKPFGVSVEYDLELCRRMAQAGAAFAAAGEPVLYFRMMAGQALEQLHALEPEEKRSKDA